MLEEVLRQQTCIRIRVVPTNHHQTIKFQGLTILKTLLELFLSLYLVSSTLYHIETTY